MKTHSTAFRSSAVAACVFAALSSYAQNKPATADDAATLGTTVVTAGRTAQSLNDVIADMTIVDRATIEKSGANSVADILVRQPGIELVRNGGPAGSTSLYVRGAPSQYTAVLIDGVRVDSQAGSGGASWNSIPASQIEYIEILRGPCAAVYGSDAMAGVIQIFTRKGRQGFHPSIEFGFGTHNTQKANASVRGGTEAVDYALSIGYEKSKGYDSQPNKPTANHDRDGYSNRSAALNFGWNINTVHRLELNTLDSHTKGQYDTSPTKDDTTVNDTRTLGLNWHAKWNENYQSRVSITQGTDYYETKPSVYETTTDIKTYLWHNEYRQGVHLLTADVERREDNIQNTSLTPTPVAKRSQNAFALGYGLSLNAHSLQLNLRQDDDSDFGRKSTGNLGYAFSFGDGWRVSASTGTAFRAPSLYQRFSVYGSANLRAEEGRSHELGLRYANSGNELSLTVYNSNYSNQIIFGPAGPCAGSGCYVNVAKAKNQGLTLAAATSVKDVRLTGSLDLQEPKDVTTGKILARRARQTLKLTADTQIAGFNLGAEAQRVGRRFDDAKNLKPLKAYSLLNLSMSKPIAKGWDIVGRVDNLGNKDYETAGGYATGGRQFYVGMRWQGE